MIACCIATNPHAASNPFGAPVADFEPSDEAIPTFTNVNFTDLSTGFPTSWQWYINGSLFSIAQNPSYFFASPGFWNILLVAANAYGSNSHSHTIEVDSGGIQP